MPAIDAKVRIGREQDRIGKNFAHAHKARIRETHWNVSVFSQKCNDVIQMFVELEAADHGTPAEKLDQTG
jgi:hypothetical protein